MDAAAEAARGAGEAVLHRLAGSDQATELIREGAALVLRRGPVLVRVRPAAELEVASREVQMALALASAQVPVTELVEPDGQPWAVDGQVVTAWRWSSGGAPVTEADLGRLARTLRDRTAHLATTVAPFDPIEAVLHLVAHHPTDDPQGRFLRSRAADLAGDWAEAADGDPLGRAIVHGDLHRGNVVPGPDGPLLTDLELTGSGPASYDAARAVVSVERYGAEPSVVEPFFQSFGTDPRSWSGFATFVALYELQVTAWAVGVRDHDPVWATEAARRVATLRDGAQETWTLH